MDRVTLGVRTRLGRRSDEGEVVADEQHGGSAERRVVREVGTATRLVRNLLAPPLQAIGITQAEYHLMAYLEEHGTSTGKQLSCLLNLDKTTVSRQLTALAESGLILRTTDPANRRSQLITLTGAGRERLASARAMTLAMLEERFAGWAPDDLDALADHLARFNDALRGGPSDPPRPGPEDTTGDTTG